MYSKKYQLNILVLVALFFLSCFLAPAVNSKSKSANSDEGQAQLMRQINAGQKSKQLTAKEANNLRKNLAKVARKKAKFLNKTGQKLNDNDKADIKRDLDEISKNIQKLELQRRAKAR